MGKFYRSWQLVMTELRHPRSKKQLIDVSSVSGPFRVALYTP